MAFIVIPWRLSSVQIIILKHSQPSAESIASFNKMLFIFKPTIFNECDKTDRLSYSHSVTTPFRPVLWSNSNDSQKWSNSKYNDSLTNRTPIVKLKVRHAGVCFHLHVQTSQLWHLFSLIILNPTNTLLENARLDSINKHQYRDLHQLNLIHFTCKASQQPTKQASPNPPCQSGCCWRSRGLEADPRRWKRHLESRCSFCFARSDTSSTAARKHPSSGRHSAKPRYGPTAHF